MMSKQIGEVGGYGRVRYTLSEDGTITQHPHECNGFRTAVVARFDADGYVQDLNPYAADHSTAINHLRTYWDLARRGSDAT